MTMFNRFRKPPADADDNLELNLEAQRAQQIAADAAAQTKAPAIPLPVVQQTATPVQPQQVGMDAATIAERERALNDSLYLANQVLGFELHPEHELLLEALLDADAQDVLVLWSRGVGKTSCISVAVVRELLRNPNLRILYVTADIDLAKQRLKQIADIFDNPTPRFARLFPEYCELEHRVAEEFTVQPRTDRVSIDPSFAISTILSTNVGSRADLLLLDDIVSDKNADSEYSREKTFQQYQLMRGLRASGARLILSGTVYHEDDTYARIRRAVQGVSAGWRISVQPCWQHLCTNCYHKHLWHEGDICRLCQRAGHSCPTFVQGARGVLIDARRTKSGGTFGWTIESLMLEREPSRMGVANFARQMELNCDPAVMHDWKPYTEEMLNKLYGRIR